MYAKLLEHCLMPNCCGHGCIETAEAIIIDTETELKESP